MALGRVAYDKISGDLASETTVVHHISLFAHSLAFCLCLYFNLRYN